MPDILDATRPEQNAAVLASAGTGKTWLLVSRILRLLLEGARPDSILAITFTRKAASEIQIRILERLKYFLDRSDAEISQKLAEIGIQGDTATCTRARSLYESLLFSATSVRATTFHAFCQELLQRFPLEANLPPGFELIESTSELYKQAWDALFAEATRAPDSPLARNLEFLFEQCGGLANTLHALDSFLNHRSDWWAFTETARHPVQYAQSCLQRTLTIDPEHDPLASFWTVETTDLIGRYAELIGKHQTATMQGLHTGLRDCLDHSASLDRRYQSLNGALLTQKGEPRIHKESKAQAKSMGEAGQAQFLQLHADLCARLMTLRDQQARLQNYRVSSAWYDAGHRLLGYFQGIKQEQRLLDFSDLEWKTYELLNHSDNAHWVQYKLDQRIDHFLLDEFQDTNPTQWRLLLPLFRELQYQKSSKSVFLVGDAKQSIYRFRRADPLLLGQATEWLKSSLSAEQFSMDASRRSSPAIMECVNAIFLQDEIDRQHYPFHKHETHLRELYGKVELIPLVEANEKEEAQVSGFRNPLLQPRTVETASPFYQEGLKIAERIRTLITDKTCIQHNGGTRMLTFSDIFILLRSRTHVEHIQRALRDAGIPYVGADRGTLLQSLEIRDLEALLNLLITPYDNISLAQVLKSPIFGLVEDDLIAVMQSDTTLKWIDRLHMLATQHPPLHPVARASRLLREWYDLNQVLPVHDLLDRIYHEGGIIERYIAAYPPSLKPRVRSNLTRFIELALEIDSGRYPSLSQFLNRLKTLRSHQQDAPDEPPYDGGGERVQIMTIHAAKGLEAPVVFLADTASTAQGRSSWECLVDWPTETPRPLSFHLLPRQGQRDLVSDSLQEKNIRALQVEDLNLLYVALTRARQFLFISGSASKKSTDSSWYSLIQRGLEGIAIEEQGSLVHVSGEAPPCKETDIHQADQGPPPDIHWLDKTKVLHPMFTEIAPSATSHASDSNPQDEDGRLRGQIIHRILERMTGKKGGSKETICNDIALEFQLDANRDAIGSWYDEAREVICDFQLAEIFQVPEDVLTYNEIPIQYRDRGQTVYGVIDRLVVYPDKVWLVDYKTHAYASGDRIPELAETYARQIALYRTGVETLWPDRSIIAALLFTASRILYTYPDTWPV